MTAYPTLLGAPPIVIAHRGASGYLPEHTLAAYTRAITQGADFIEPDLVSTQDGVLIARHEPNLIDTTNVSTIAKFADRRKSLVLDGKAEDGFFSNDFTLAEIKQLRARQSHPYREQSYNDQFKIPTFQEILDLVNQTEAQTGRRVGIYPETKHPTYFAQLGLALEEPLIDALIANHITDSGRVFIQSFEVTNLKDILAPLMADKGIALPLIQLYEHFQQQPYDFVVSGDPRTYGDLIRRDCLLDFVSTYATGIGVWKRSILLAEPIAFDMDENRTDLSAATERLTGKILPIIADAHAAGLLVHAYTFRNEEHFLAAQYNGDPIAEYQQVYQLGVDGVFSDFPDTALMARDQNFGF